MPPAPIPAHQNETAIEQMYTAHHQALVAYLTRLLGDRMAAEDLCQETFLKVLRSWNNQAEIANAGAWLYRIATNTAYDYMRRRKRIQFTPLSDLSPALGTESMETRLHEQEPVQRVLAQLPAESRRLLVLASCAGHNTREIAAALDCSDSAVRLRLFRARARFRKIYLKQSA